MKTSLQMLGGTQYSDEDARAAAVNNSITDGNTDTAPSEDAVHGALESLRGTNVTAYWYETVSSGTTGTVTPPSGSLVFDKWPDGVDAVASKIGSQGKPNWETPLTDAGSPITVALDADGSFALSGTASGYPVAVVYAYRTTLDAFDDTLNLAETTLEPSASEVFDDSDVGQGTVKGALEWLHNSLFSKNPSDLNQEGAADGEAIVWNGTAGQWEPAAVSSGSGSDIIYGIKWDAENDIMTQGVVIDGIFYEAAPSELPVHDAHKRVLRDAATGSVSYLHPDNSNNLEDGTSATLDGSAGDVQVESPAFYELWLRDGIMQYILVSLAPFSFKGRAAAIPGHFGSGSYYYYDALESVKEDATNGLVQGTGNNDLVSGDVLRSLPGYTPWTDQTRDECRSAIANRGGTSHQWSWSAYQSLVALFVIKYGTWDSQSALPGYTWQGSWSYSYTKETGLTMELGNADGVIYDSSDRAIANSFLGIENLFGHVWSFVDGINIDNSSGDCHVYVQSDPSLFVDDTSSNYSDTGIAPGFGDTDNYIVDIHGGGNLAPLYPVDISGGSSATYLCDYHWNSAGGWRVLLVGAALASGGKAGVAALYAAGDSASRLANIGSRGAAREDT